MDDLVERLRRCTYTLGPSGRENPKPINPDGPEAADRIEKLEAENARLRHILKEDGLCDPELADRISKLRATITSSAR